MEQSSKIRISVWDQDILNTDNKFGTCVQNFLDVKALRGKSLGPRWYNLYGAPQGVDYISDVRSRMNAFPNSASTWNGRVLLGFRLEANKNDDAEAGKAGKQNHPEYVHRVAAPPLPKKMYPTMSKKVLRLLVLTGSELPGFAGLLKGVSKLSIRLQFGSYSTTTKAVRPSNGYASWCETLELKCVVPADPTQVVSTGRTEVYP